MNKLFTYGTLKNPTILKEILGREVSGTPDVLSGYGKEKIEIEGQIYPRIVLNESKEVVGLVIEISDDELEKVDLYETAEYKRILVILKSGISAYVYA